MTARATVRPPNPESNIPIGRSTARQATASAPASPGPAGAPIRPAGTVGRSARRRRRRRRVGERPAALAGGDDVTGGRVHGDVRVVGWPAPGRQPRAVGDEVVDLAVDGQPGVEAGALGLGPVERRQHPEHGHARQRVGLVRRTQSSDAEPGERLQHGHEGAALGRRRVHRAGGGRRELLVLDDALGLEVAQALGEEVGGDAGECPPQVGEATVAGQQLAHDQQRPPVADDVEGGGDRAVLVVGPVAHVTNPIPEHFLTSTV